jgi:hypothetical protein
VANDIAKEASTKADEYVETLLKLQSQEQEAISSMRQALADLAKSLSSAESETGKRPLVFIIDELGSGLITSS